MYWPLERPAVARADVPFGNRIFLESHKARVDASMTWGTDVDVSALEDYAREATRQQAVLISPLHVMLKAIGVSLDRTRISTVVSSGAVSTVSVTSTCCWLFRTCIGVRRI